MDNQTNPLPGPNNKEFMQTFEAGYSLPPFAHNYNIEEFHHAHDLDSISETKKDVPYIQ